MPPLRLFRRFTLALASAALSVLAQEPHGAWPLMLLAMPLLLMATVGSSDRVAFYLGWLQGTVAAAGSLWWFWRLFSAAAVLLFLLLGFFIACFCLLANKAWRMRLAAPAWMLLAAVLWTGIEFYRSECFVLRFPWMTPGVALGPVFLTPWVGVYGQSFLILAAAAGCLRRETRLASTLLGLCLLLAGNWRPSAAAPAPDRTHPVLLVQKEEALIEDYLALTRGASARVRPRLVVWPEYALPYDVRAKGYEPELAELVRLCAELDCLLVVGTKTGNDPVAWFNTALLISAKGPVGEHHKVRPVHYFNDGRPGKTLRPVDTELGRIAMPICFDNDYTRVPLALARSGAELFLAPSFDAAHWSADQHLQHARLFALRAAETGRWIAVAASSGVSQILDPHGVVHASLPPLESGVLTGQVSFTAGNTPYVLATWVLPWLCMYALLFLTPWIWRRAATAEPGRLQAGLFPGGSR